MDTRVLIQSASNIMQPFPTPSDATHKFDKINQLASEIFKFESVKFSSFKGKKSKVSSLIRPEIKLVRAFKPVLVTSNFDDDSIKNEWANMETVFSHYKSMGNF